MSEKFSEDVHLKCLQGLRTGGFVCLLPQIIDAAWGGYALRLAGFPITVFFTGLSPHSQPGGQLAVASCYTFDPATYFENEDVRTMTYFTDPRSIYRVELDCHKGESRWEGRKLCDEKVLLNASGPEWQQFIIQLTMRGIDPDEPAESVRTLDGRGGVRIFIFSPER